MTASATVNRSSTKRSRRNTCCSCWRRWASVIVLLFRLTDVSLGHSIGSSHSSPDYNNRQQLRREVENSVNYAHLSRSVSRTARQVEPHIFGDDVSSAQSTDGLGQFKVHASLSPDEDEDDPISPVLRELIEPADDQEVIESLNYSGLPSSPSLPQKLAIIPRFSEDYEEPQPRSAAQKKLPVEKLDEQGNATTTTTTTTTLSSPPSSSITPSTVKPVADLQQVSSKEERDLNDSNSLGSGESIVEQQRVHANPDEPPMAADDSNASIQLAWGEGSPATCESDDECTYGGVCVDGLEGGARRCLCSASCPSTIPATCTEPFGRYGNRRDEKPTCLTMGRDYQDKYKMPEPACHDGFCVCPPQFRPGKAESHSPNANQVFRELPVKCHKSQLSVLALAEPSDAVYKGADVSLLCCLNMDPRGVVERKGVVMIQNGTIYREPTWTPYDTFDSISPDSEGLGGRLMDNSAQILLARFSPPKCWVFNITNVQISDSGNYRCEAQSLYNRSAVVHSNIPFVVKAPRTVENLSVVVINSTFANVSWTQQAGPMLKVDMMLKRRTDNAQVWKADNAKSPEVIGNLQPFAPYTLFYTVMDGNKEVGRYTEQFTTKEDVPGPPSLGDIRLIGPMGSSAECEIEWSPPQTPNGRITKYWVTVKGSVRYVELGGALAGEHYPEATTEGCTNFGVKPHDPVLPDSHPGHFISCRFGLLRPNRNYTAVIVAENGAGQSEPIVFPKQCITDYGEPDVIPAPRPVATKNTTTFTLRMGPTPDQTNGPISCYYLAIVPLLSNGSVRGLPQPGQLVIDSFAKSMHNNLIAAEASKRYFAYIAESYTELPDATVVGDGDLSAGAEPCNTWYLSRNKPEDPALKSGMQYSGFLIARVDRDPNITHLPHEGFFVRKRRRRRQIVPTPFRHHTFTPDPAYGFSPFFKPVMFKAVDPFDTEDGGSSSGGVIASVLSILVLLLLSGAAAFVYMHRKGYVKELCPQKKASGGESALARRQQDHRLLNKHAGFQPIAVEDLPSEYVIRHRDSDFLFSAEFDALPHYTNFDTTASDRRENQRKNRYNDIKAYDVTRVKLRSDGGGESSNDYVNANFVQGYKGRKAFIAAQGPLEGTVGDFWRMVWEHHVQIIVMVTNLYEKYRAQCTKYWPDDEPLTYDKVEVKPIESNYYADYAVRVFEIGRPSTDARRIVQYHYTGWSDYRAPECTTGLLRFLSKLRRLEAFNETPVVVHCSAGVGRTGTFIAIDGVMDQCAEEGKADVFGFVSNLRRQRNFMVQSLEQYVFVYKALAEWHLFSDTDVEVDRIHEHIAKLKEPWSGETTTVSQQSPSRSPSKTSGSSVKGSSPPSRAPATGAGAGGGGGSGMEAEFKMLSKTLEIGRACEFAKKEEHLTKNRFGNIVPYDRNRVILGPLVGYADASYINASVVRGYFYPYILAQDPMSNATCYDFWRMVGEQNATSIVMLSCDSDFSPNERYWPDEMSRGKTYGGDKEADIAVQLASEEKHQTYTTRKFTVCRSKDKDLREVVQFMYRDWPANQCTPGTTGTLLELIGRVLQRQSYLPDSGPIILHCRDGSTRSGLYCCVSLLLERLKAEGRVDVFQTVKSLQAQRPMVLNSLDQYSFCYKAVLDYLESFR